MLLRDWREVYMRKKQSFNSKLQFKLLINQQQKRIKLKQYFSFYNQGDVFINKKYLISQHKNI